MSARAEDVKNAAQEAIGTKDKIEEHIDGLTDKSRLKRQHSASVIAEISRMDVEQLVPFAAALVDALDTPEAQTRWEVLDALTALTELDSRTCEKAFDDAETALFDENSGPLRLSAMRFLCKLGSTTANRSEKSWDLIDEGIQCYHGDVEFNEMLEALVVFSSGKLSNKVKEEFAARMRFDADNASGVLGARAKQIEENLTK